MIAKLRAWTSRRPLLTATIALVIGVALGAVSYSSTVDDLRAQNAALEEERDSLGDDLNAEATAADAAEVSAQDQIAAAEEEVADALADLEDREQQLDKRERDLDRRARKVNRAERQIERSTFSDGIWQVGTDIQPGTYRAPGGGGATGLYWVAPTRRTSSTTVVSLRTRR